MIPRSSTQAPLSGLKVIDASTINAGPTCAMLLGDFGAEVIKVEQPGVGDQARHTGAQKDGVPLVWQYMNRNKKSVTINLRSTRGQELFKRLIADADVLIENFRPGILEGWNLGWDELKAVNPRLIMLMITGFGQTGPYAGRAGFGTLAEAISGFAYITGAPDGPPTLPPFGLSDGIAAYLGAYACMVAVYERDVAASGLGQYIDLSLFEPIFAILGAQSTIFDQLGTVQKRFGNRVPGAAPRSAYRTADGHWVAISAGHQHMAPRVLRVIGGQELADDARFKDSQARVAHGNLLDEMLKEWIGSRKLDDVMTAFLKEDAAVAPVYNIEQIFNDEQYTARSSIASVEHPKLGAIKMQNVFPKFSRTPGAIRSPGPELGAHNHEIFVDRLGMSPVEFELLRSENVI
ncbi:MAG: CoA transferase [Vulcanimicrobiaceae bacterium]